MRSLVLFTLCVLVPLPTTTSAETHRLAPSVFVNTFSAAHAPVLRIKSGDSCRHRRG
jgi:hypothetical protein